MKKVAGITLLLMWLLNPLNALYAQTQTGADEDWSKLARKVVEHVAGIQPAEAVMISGGQHVIPLMEALSIQTQHHGGFPSMLLSTDKVMRDYYSAVPMKYLMQDQRYLGEWLNHIDVWINVSAVENYKTLMRDVPEARFAAIAKSEQSIAQMIDQSGIRLVNLPVPTQEMADIHSIPLDRFKAIYRDAIEADCQVIAKKGALIKEMLHHAKDIHITTPQGTDFHLQCGERPVMIDDGMISQAEVNAAEMRHRFVNLPGGKIFVAPLESTVNGRVYVPRMLSSDSYECMEKISFQLVNGVIRDFKAQKGIEIYEKRMAPYTGPKERFALLVIGLNPAMPVMREHDYLPLHASGMVKISFGHNEIWGGENKTDAYFSFPLVGATVKMDGKVVVNNGKLSI